MNPLLSIITATYNSESSLDETIRSILTQNYNDFEYIIVDGNSTDNTIRIITKYEPLFKEKKIRFKWISEEDLGIYDAWNKGLRLAEGKWISFLGSDDTYLEGALKKYAHMAKANPEADFIHSKVKLISNGKIKFVVSDKWNWSQFKRYMKIAHVGSFHNAEYFEKYGRYNELYRLAGDYEMLLRAKSNLKTVFFDEFTAEMKDGGISNDNVLLAFKEVKYAKTTTAKITKPIALFDFYHSLIKYYLSTFIRRIS